MTFLPQIDLSGNQLANIRTGAFSGLSSLRRLNLSRNRLQAFRGEILEAPGEGDSSALRELDLSSNQLGYLFPNSFRAHPRLRRLVLAQNKLTFFPGELLAGLRSVARSGSALLLSCAPATLCTVLFTSLPAGTSRRWT